MNDRIDKRKWMMNNLMKESEWIKNKWKKGNEWLKQGAWEKMKTIDKRMNERKWNKDE